MIIVELSPTAGVTVTERGGVRHAATAGMGGISSAHAASTTATGRSVASATVTRCGSAAGVHSSGRRATSGAGRGRRGGMEGRAPALTPAAAATDGDGRRARGGDARQAAGAGKHTRHGRLRVVSGE